MGREAREVRSQVVWGADPLTNPRSLSRCRDVPSPLHRSRGLSAAEVRVEEGDAQGRGTVS